MLDQGVADNWETASGVTYGVASSPPELSVGMSIVVVVGSKPVPDVLEVLTVSDGLPVVPSTTALEVSPTLAPPGNAAACGCSVAF